MYEQLNTDPHQAIIMKKHVHLDKTLLAILFNSTKAFKRPFSHKTILIWKTKIFALPESLKFGTFFMLKRYP